MDFNNGLYVFNGVPGLEASKGERIAKSLQKLQTKIKQLEQVRNSGRETSSKNGSTDTQDITLLDVQLKLFSLQIQYLRVKLRNTKQGRAESTALQIEHGHEQSESEYCEMENCCKETQTGISLHEHVFSMPISAASHTQETQTCNTSQQTVPAGKATTSSNFNAVKSRDNLPSEVVPPSSNDVQPHYLFDVKDFPFILGACAFDSHNVKAKVQNIFAKLKTHNRALCGSKFQASQNCASSLTENDRMMNEISKDLTELQIKQAELIHRIDNQNTNLLVGKQEEDLPYNKSENIKKQAKELSKNDFTTSHVTAGLCSKKRQVTSTRAIKKNKHVVPTNKMRANLPQVARRRLIRSIRDFRTELSKEDITWV